MEKSQAVAHQTIAESFASSGIAITHIPHLLLRQAFHHLASFPFTS